MTTLLRRDAKVEIGTHPPTSQVLTQGKSLQIQIENTAHLLCFSGRKTYWIPHSFDRYNSRLSKEISKKKLESDSRGSGKPTHVMSQN